MKVSQTKIDLIILCGLTIADLTDNAQTSDPKDFGDTLREICGISTKQT